MYNPTLRYGSARGRKTDSSNILPDLLKAKDDKVLLTRGRWVSALYLTTMKGWGISFDQEILEGMKDFSFNTNPLGMPPVVRERWGEVLGLSPLRSPICYMIGLMAASPIPILVEREEKQKCLIGRGGTGEGI